MVRKASLIAAVLLVLGAATASAGTIDWVDWTAATVGDPGSANGAFSNGIQVRYAGEVVEPQTDGTGIDYWNDKNPEPYQVPNGPPDSDIIRLRNGTAGKTNTLTFSKPVTNPLMAIMSLGQPSLPVYYDFDAPFDIVKSGTGYWGGAASGSLFEQAGDVLQGVEGHGVIRFQGTFTSISWVDTPDEYWHGFTVGIQAVPLPSAALLGLAGLAGLTVLRRRRRK